MSRPPRDLSMDIQRYTLITGASSDIGRAIAIRLSPERSLILHGRSGQRLAETRRQCANPEEHLLWPLDLAEPTLIREALAGLLSIQPRVVDNFVHCAAELHVLPMRQMDLLVAQRIMAVTFHSAAEIIRLLLKRAINRGQLRGIVLVSSVASEFGARGFNLYCASKGALDALMRALAVELAPDVRVNSVLPGGLRTRTTEAMFGEHQVSGCGGASAPLGPGRPEDVACAVEFLVSERARWVTGQQLVIDGGRSVDLSG